MDELSSELVWLVYREDTRGNKFMLEHRHGFSEEAAEAVVDLFTQHGHKQTYFKLSYQRGRTLSGVLAEHGITR